MFKTSVKPFVMSEYKPNLFIKVGAIFNILFASIFSLLIFTLILTIPTIVTNYSLLRTRVSSRRYYGFSRIFAILLSFSLTFIVLLSFAFATKLSLDIYDNISTFIENVTFDWVHLPEVDSVNESPIAIAIISSIAAIGFFGPLFVSIGWYKQSKLITESQTQNTLIKANKKNKKLNDPQYSDPLFVVEALKDLEEFSFKKDKDKKNKK